MREVAFEFGNHGYLHYLRASSRTVALRWSAELLKLGMLGNIQGNRSDIYKKKRLPQFLHLRLILFRNNAVSNIFDSFQSNILSPPPISIVFVK